MTEKIEVSQQEQDAKIYKAYIHAQNMVVGKKSVDKIAEDFGISRTSVYEAIKRVKNGNIPMIRKALCDCRNEALWEHKYKTIVLCLPDNRKKWSVHELKAVINSMSKDGFTDALIAKKLKINRSTVEHHLGK